MPREVEFARIKSFREGRSDDSASEKLMPPAPYEESLAEIQQRLETKIRSVPIPRDLKFCHPVIRKLLDADIVRSGKFLSSDRNFFDRPYFESPFEQRRLRALSALFVCLQKQGVRVSGSGKNPKEFSARVGEMSVSILIDDPQAERVSWRSTSEIGKRSSDPMIAKVGMGRSVSGVQTFWQDQPGDKVEAHLCEIAVNVLVAGESCYRARETAHYEWRKESEERLLGEQRKAREEAERAERARCLKQEAERVERLLNEANALRQAAEIRAYVSSVQQINQSAVDPVSDDELNDWAEWALAQADRIDPVQSRRFLEM